VELGAAAAARDGGGGSVRWGTACGEDGGVRGRAARAGCGARVTGRRCRGGGRRWDAARDARSGRPGRARWQERGGKRRRRRARGEDCAGWEKRPGRALKETTRNFYSGARRQDLWRRAPVHVGATSALGTGIRSCHVTARRHRLWRRAVLPRRHSLWRRASGPNMQIKFLGGPNVNLCHKRG
jgi:hypothetical protein